MNSEIIVTFVIILYCPTMSKIVTINYLLANGKNLIANKALIGDGNTYMPLLGMFLFYSGEMREIILFSVMEIEPQVLCVPSVHSALEPHLCFLWRKQDINYGNSIGISQKHHRIVCDSEIPIPGTFPINLK